MGKRKVPPFFLFRLPTFLLVQQSPALKLFLVMQGDAISHSKVVDLSLYTLLYSFEENKSPTRKCVDLNLHLRQTPLQGGQNLYRLPQNDCHCQLFPAITILPGTWSNSVAAVLIFISKILSCCTPLTLSKLSEPSSTQTQLSSPRKRRAAVAYFQNCADSTFPRGRLLYSETGVLRIARFFADQNVYRSVHLCLGLQESAYQLQF